MGFVLSYVVGEAARGMLRYRQDALLDNESSGREDDLPGEYHRDDSLLVVDREYQLAVSEEGTERDCGSCCRRSGCKGRPRRRGWASANAC